MSADSSFLRTPGYKEVMAWAFTLPADTSIRGLLLLVKESTGDFIIGGGYSLSL